MSIRNTVDSDIADDEELRRLAQIEKNQSLIALLDSWRDVSPEEMKEQRKSWEYLKKALDKDRPEGAKLFK